LFLRTTASALVWRTAGAIAAAANAKRSLWIWQTPLTEAGDVAAFARRNDFDTLFFSVPRDDRPALAKGDAGVLSALRTLRGEGRALYLTAGDPSWALKAPSEAPLTVRRLLEAHLREVFDGLALDVEPHTLAAWKDGSDKAAIAANYVRVLELIRAEAAQQNLTVLATVHPTYAKYSPRSGGETVLQSAARAVDATDLMAYRNAEGSLESFAGDAMQQLAALGKPWWLGVSTHTKSPAGTSYATLPASAFFPSIDKTSSDLGQRYGTSFAGIAVEDYRNTHALLNA
jgi:hypothetical protein